MELSLYSLHEFDAFLESEAETETVRKIVSA